MSSPLNYQPWLQAVLRIAKHYRIETSEERLRLQLNWNQSESITDTLTLITRQLGMSLRQVPFSRDLLNPWLLPVVVELSDGQVAVIEKADADGNISIQFSADEGLTQTYTIAKLQEHIRFVYIIRPEKSVSDVRVDEYIKPYEASWFWGIVLQ
ncbi:MAG: cysteine peptidase family C39 domain-containing protein, partial [Acinetobacter sp.]